MRHAILTAAVIAAFATGPASGQTITISPRSDAPAPLQPELRRAPTRVSLNLQTLVPMPANSDASAQIDGTAELRRKLYEATDHECLVLSQVYDAECRLSQVTVNVSIQERGTLGQFSSASANASYELTARVKAAPK